VAFSTRTILTDGERQVAAYLRQRRLPWAYEVATGGRRPDFRVNHPDQAFALEVYEPEIRLPSEQRAGAVDSYPSLRNAFAGRKGKQASATRKAGLPYVVALAATNSDIGIDPFLVAGAMFGNVGVQFPIGPGVDPSSAPNVRNVFLGGARLQPAINRGVSAVAVPIVFNPTKWRVEALITARLGHPESCWRADMTPGETRRLQTGVLRFIEDAYRHADEIGTYDQHARVVRMVVLHNPHAQHPLSRRVFAGPHDEQWWHEADGSYGARDSGPLISEYAGMSA